MTTVQSGDLEPANQPVAEDFPTCDLAGCACEARGCGVPTVQLSLDTAQLIPLSALGAPAISPQTMAEEAS